MSKKSKRSKLARPMKQLQQRPPVPSQQTHEQLASRAQYAREQIRKGDFAGTINTCESLLNSLPRSSELHIEVLGLLGLAHSMLQHHQESYDVFGTAISIAPTRPELWYNHGLACHHLGRHVEAVRNYERAVELSKNSTSEMARKFAKELVVGRQELQEAMKMHGPDITLEQYTEREESFAQALNFMKLEKWSEAELLFRQLAETGSRVPLYWGNLGSCLIMQHRYDEAEEALKQALTIDPDYRIARNNLQKLPEARRGKLPLGLQVINQPQDEESVNQVLTIYERDDEDEAITSTSIERSGETSTRTFWEQLGQKSPRYHLFLNHYQDTRFTVCPRCSIKTRPRKFTLVVKVHPAYAMIADKICRYCYACGLLIVHQDQLEDLLATHLTMTNNTHLIGNDYRVLGTLDRAEWNQAKQESFSFEQVIKYLHDFKEVVRFERVSG